MKIKCPKCGSKNINQFRMPTGAIWCDSCGFRVEHKEIDKSFFVKEEKNNDMEKDN